MNKKKIFNDPIYGLIRFNHEVLYEVVNHSYFQRLRRILQQALSHYVYPGALHTRFQHALGATHLMTRALDTLRSKGVDISDKEYEAVCLAILLHDVGHGPFSHALEHTLANVHHEHISQVLLERICADLNQDFTTAVQIFKGSYPRPFFNQLVTGQLDVDRMDYLTRDSFFSGVAEGVIGYDRIIMMMHVLDDQLVIEEKGIFSVEKFLMARRLMYWQVYLHKTVVSAELMLISILKRAKFLVSQGISVDCSDPLRYFLKIAIVDEDIIYHADFIDNFVLLDDIDVLYMIKGAVNHPDFILSRLCDQLLKRQLFKVKMYDIGTNDAFIEAEKKRFLQTFNIDTEALDYFYPIKSETILPYDRHQNEIQMLMKSGQKQPLSSFAPAMIQAAQQRIFQCYPVF